MAPVSTFISSLLAGVRALGPTCLRSPSRVLCTSLLAWLAPATVLLRSPPSFLVPSQAFSALRDLAHPSSPGNGGLRPLWASFLRLPSPSSSNSASGGIVRGAAWMPSRCSKEWAWGWLLKPFMKPDTYRRLWLLPHHHNVMIAWNLSMTLEVSRR